jgi:hypothetical protein
MQIKKVWLGVQKPLAIKLLFICSIAFLLGTSRFHDLFEMFKNTPIPFYLFYLLLFALLIASAGFLAGGVSIFFDKIFFKKNYRIDLDLLAGAFSLVTFFSILIKLPIGYADFLAFFILPVTNLLLILKFSAWLRTDQNLSIPLAIIYGSIMFFSNFSNFMGFLNRFSYWEGEALASWGILLIIEWPIAIVICISYLIYSDRKKRNQEKNTGI